MSADDIAQRCADVMWDNDDASRELGIAIDVIGAGRVRACMTVTRSMINGHDVCHGGYLFTLADTAFAFACNAYDRVTLAAGASIEFLRPVKEGDRLVAEATERYRGTRTGIYDVAIKNQAEETVAAFRGRSHMTKDTLL